MTIESSVILLIAWSNAIGTQYLLPTRQTKSYTISVVLGAVVNIIVNIPLILFWGAVGATVSTVLSEMTVTAYQLWSIRKQISFSRLFTETGKYFLASIVMFVIVELMSQQLATAWLMLVVEIFAGFVVYSTMLILLRADIIKEAVQLLRH